MTSPVPGFDLRLFEYRLNGFVICPGLITPGLADRMVESFQGLLSLEAEMARRGTPKSERGRHRYAVSLDPVIQKMGGPLADPAARSHEEVDRLLTALMGRWKTGRTIMECPCPGSGYMGWHVDILPEEQHRERPRIVTKVRLQIALVDITPESGPTEVIPGSHRMHYQEGDAAIRALPRLYTARILLRKGDALLRDAGLIHRGTPNRSDRPRPLYSITYNKTGG